MNKLDLNQYLFTLFILQSSVKGLYVTVQAKTSLVHTSNFDTLEIHNFLWEVSIAIVVSFCIRIFAKPSKLNMHS